MHIEPGVVDGAKLALSAAAGIASLGLIARMAAETVREAGVSALALRSAAVTGLTLTFFEILPHFPVGVSEVHFILGSTLFLVFGAGAAGIGLAAGLLIQALFLSPADLPQYAMNLTTLIVPLFALGALARQIIAPNTAYVDLSYAQALKLSTAYQGGIVAWVAFWSVYGHGFGAETLAGLSAFAGAYMTVVLIEPIADLAVLAGAKTLGRRGTGLLGQARLHAA